MNSATTINARMNAGEWLMLFALAAIWGGSFYFVAIAVTELPPLTVVLLRVGLAAATLWLIVWFTGTPVPRSLVVWRSFLIMGLLNNALPFALIVWGQTHIESGLAAILNATTPLSTVFIAGLLLTDEKITLPKLIGIAFGFIGVACMLVPALSTQADFHIYGQIAVLLAAISYSFGATYGRRFRTLGVSPLLTAAGQVTGSTLLLLPVALYFEDPLSLPMPQTTTWFSVIALAVVCTALAYILYFRILSTAGATNLALVTLLVPVTAVLLGTLLLGESLNMTHAVGMALIAVGMLIIDGRLWQRLRGA